MNNEQALQVLKQVLDAAVKGSVFPNMDTAFQAATAFNLVSQTILNKDGTNNE
jgi:hypothetical protein